MNTNSTMKIALLDEANVYHYTNIDSLMSYDNVTFTAFTKDPNKFGSVEIAAATIDFPGWLAYASNGSAGFTNQISGEFGLVYNTNLTNPSSFKFENLVIT